MDIQAGWGPVAPSVTPAEFRKTLGQFATGITVITALDESGLPYGATVSSFAALSLEPPLVQWSFTTRAPANVIFSSARHFAVNILAADQEDVSQNFCRPIDRFATVDFERGLEGLPLIAGCLAWLECGAEHQVAGGDHTIFIARVLRTRTFMKTPLLHWRGSYMTVRELHPHRTPLSKGGVADRDLEEQMCLM
jgi:flavin reductase (DIM6/NTAB) family NADH-FMN oxidoreductase RutF